MLHYAYTISIVAKFKTCNNLYVLMTDLPIFNARQTLQYAGDDAHVHWAHNTYAIDRIALAVFLLEGVVLEDHHQSLHCCVVHRSH